MSLMSWHEKNQYLLMSSISDFDFGKATLGAIKQLFLQCNAMDTGQVGHQFETSGIRGGV